MTGITAERTGWPRGGRLLGEVMNSSGQRVQEITPRPSAKQYVTGVRAIDAMCPVAEGQSVCLLGDGCAGKTTLLGMIVRWTDADACVVASIGQRKDNLERLTGGDLTREVVLVSEAEGNVGRQVETARRAFEIASGLRAEGNRVVLVIDGLGGLAQAGDVTRLVELCGCTGTGAVTGFFSCADEFWARITDVRVVLQRLIGLHGRWPAIDVTTSRWSNVGHVADACAIAASELARLMDLDTLPEPLHELAAQVRPAIESLLAQGEQEPVSLRESQAALLRTAMLASRSAIERAKGPSRRIDHETIEL